MRLTNQSFPDYDTTAVKTTRWKTILDVDLKLVTPMMGGGSVAGRPDFDYPIRSSSVRGALRRWWRASICFSNFAEMKSREAALWGMVGETATSSRVKVEVIANPIPAADITNLIDSRSPAYAYGVLSGERRKTDDEKTKILNKCEFKVIVSVLDLNSEYRVSDEEIDEVRRAFGCWVMFGGIGSRTRRGFGALQMVPADKSHPSTELCSNVSHLLGSLPKPVVKVEFPSGFTSLHGGSVFVSKVPCENVMKAWTDSVEVLRCFRKGQMLGSERPSDGMASHSPWPEADSLRGPGRELRKMGGKVAFPRAELGLPLEIRSIEGSSGYFGNGRVPGFSANDRLASPVIVRPLLIDGKWHAGVIVMKTGRLTANGVNTDCTGYPDNLYGRSVTGRSYDNSSQRKEGILDAFKDVVQSYYDLKEVKGA
jgi:CRISPR-associated protein Cmr1